MQDAAKHEWRKQEKTLYLPKTRPEILDVPAFNFITISGAGNPNSDAFAARIAALYPIAYGIKMGLKKSGPRPDGYRDFTVYPLEGLWDIREEAREGFAGTIDKDDLVYTLMIRQPDFVTEAIFAEAVAGAAAKKPDEDFSQVGFETIAEGHCVHMLHAGSFDDEAESFARMETFAGENGLERVSKIHREIYLSDFRKVPEEKLKTVLRFSVRPVR